MNNRNRGQFSIIAALLVAVVLIAAVMTTYSSIRYSQFPDQPQFLSAVDEINLALKQMLGFTVGYYGSVLKVTGNTSYARALAANYLSSGLSNIGDIRPEWGTSFNVTKLKLSANWFTNVSYSEGTIEVKYDLTGLGIYDIVYSTSSRIDVLIPKPTSASYAQLRILQDGEPLINLGLNKLKFYRYIYSDASWELTSPTSLTSYANGTYLLGIPLNVSWDAFTIQIEDPRGLIVTASSFNHYAVTLTWDQKFSTVANENMVVELLQNGTMRWLGQNLNLTKATIPIPSIPVKSIHVSQVVAGVSQEVPFQIEDWASEYRVPLGLASSVSLFSSRTMVVFLANSKCSKITIWWDGSDEAVQTPLAYANNYFNDNPSAATLNNGKLDLKFSSTGFTLTSTTGSTTSISNLMRINGKEDTTAPELAYVIYNGVVRDIVQGEAEWGNGGIVNCPNVYSNIVITLPANVNYYTYQLRLMFMNSQQQRTITNMCPIRVCTNFGGATMMTEDGTSSGVPIVINGTGAFHNYSSAWTPHRWSQIITDTSGAGIMFTDTANQRLYAFDSTSPKTATGALNVTNNSGGTIEFSPVTLRPVQFNNAFDITWNGAVVTFSNTTPIYKLEGSTPTGLWILSEYPPTATVTAEN
jgi:hypothetical protein